MNVCQPSRYLVVSTVGDRSQHRAWLQGPGLRDFDLLLIYYGDDPHYTFGPAEHKFQRKGFKYDLIASVLEKQPELFQRYEAIWCPDDDILARQSQISRLFEIFTEQRFALAQPAIGLGESSYQSLRQRPNTFFRYTPYVEVMCPIFSRAAFFKASTLFRETRSGWGIDWVWSKWFDPREVAIIDEVAVHHTGKLMRGELYQKLKLKGIDPFAEFDAVVRKYGGINRKVHKQMISGRMPMTCVPLPGRPRTFGEKVTALLRWGA